ncbi:hypothetical protein DWU95_33495, partial [Burkholderia contaminans]
VWDVGGGRSAARGERRKGVAQVVQGVVQRENIRQPNAGLVEQGAAASGSLKQQATRLVDAVNVFR